MASTDARPVPKKNTAYRHYFAIRKNDGTLITTWAGMDSERSLDGATFADCTNEATEIGTTGIGYIDLTSTEMNTDATVLKVTVTNTDALPYVVTFFPEEAGDIRTDVTQIGGSAQSMTDLKDFADAGYDPATNKVQGVVLVDTITTYTGNTPQTADHTAGIADIPTVSEFNARTLVAASYFDPAADTVANVTTVATCTTNTDMRGTDGANTTTPPTAAAITDAVWDELLSGHVISGSAGEQLAAAGAGGDPWATALPGAYGAGTAGKIIGDNLDATVSSRGTSANQTTMLSNQTTINTNVLANATLINDVPTVAEFNARTLLASAYFDPATDTVAHVTLVDTTTTNTDMVAAVPTDGSHTVTLANAVAHGGATATFELGSAGATVPFKVSTSGADQAVLFENTKSGGIGQKIVASGIGVTYGQWVEGSIGGMFYSPTSATGKGLYAHAAGAGAGAFGFHANASTGQGVVMEGGTYALQHNGPVISTANWTWSSGGLVVDITGNLVGTVSTVTTNTDMRGTDNAMLATEDGSSFSAIPDMGLASNQTTINTNVLANATLIGALNDPTAAAIATAVMGEVIEGTVTLKQAIMIAIAAGAGKLSGAPSGPILVRDTTDSKDRITATVDSDGNRLTVVLDLT